jgi:hypothetical protein
VNGGEERRNGTVRDQRRRSNPRTVLETVRLHTNLRHRPRTRIRHGEPLNIVVIVFVIERSPGARAFVWFEMTMDQFGMMAVGCSSNVDVLFG